MASNFPKIVLITGEPGVGKTTLLKKLYEKLSLYTSKNLKGFYTVEIRDNFNSRIGFDVIDFKDNKRAPLARLTSGQNINLPKVGKYSVDLISFEKIALPMLKDLDCQAIYLIDEIGKMESYSKEFERLILNMLQKIDTDNIILVATVPTRNLSLADKLKRHSLSQTFTVTLQNRNKIISDLYNVLEKKLTA